MIAFLSAPFYCLGVAKISVKTKFIRSTNLPKRLAALAVFSLYTATPLNCTLHLHSAAARISAAFKWGCGVYLFIYSILREWAYCGTRPAAHLCFSGFTLQHSLGAYSTSRCGSFYIDLQRSSICGKGLKPTKYKGASVDFGLG